MAQWINYALNGYRRYNAGEMMITFMDVGTGRIFRIEDEIEVASGIGGTLSVVRPSYVFVPNTATTAAPVAVITDTQYTS